MENKIKCHKCGESMRVYVTPGKIEVNVYCNVCDIRVAVFNTKRKKAPELDYNGNVLYEGDTIIHPSGQRGEIKYYRLPGLSNKWRVFYDGDKSDHSALFFQVGHGQAVWKREKRKSIRAGGDPGKVETEEETVSCDLCGKPTPMTGTKLCDLCYSVQQIFDKPDLIVKAIANLRGDRHENKKKLHMLQMWG